MSPAEAQSPSNDRPSRGRRRVLGEALALCVVGLLIYVVLPGSSGGSGQDAIRSSLACAGPGTPRVLNVPPTDLGALRDTVARVLPGRVGRLYEEGTISGANIWNDEPPSGPTVSTTARRQGGYEMRWWAPNGDDLVADVLVFASAQDAAQFMQRASERRCGHALALGPADSPPQGRNLIWMNPDGVAESDVYLARGRRVYRVGDVPAGQQHERSSGARLRRTLTTVDALACLLPGAHCATAASQSVPA